MPTREYPSAVARRRARMVVGLLFGVGVVLSFALVRLDAALPGRASGDRSRDSRAATQTARRIIPGSPALTELVFALGQGHRVAGVSEPCTYPPEALTLPRVGSLYNPDFERLMVLHPDFVVVQGRQDRLEAWAEREGVRFQSVGRLDSLADLRNVILDLGDLLEVPEEARRLRKRIDRGLAAVAASVQGTRLVPVFLTFGRSPGNLTTLYTCGPGSFLNDLLQIAGGRNIFSDAAGAFPVVSKEALLERAPEVILELVPEPVDEETASRLRRDWEVMSGIPAVSTGRIVYLAGGQYQIPGPRVVETARAFARALHPERFEDD